LIIAVAKQIFGKIEAGTLKPFGVHHPLSRGQNGIIGLGSLNFTKLPHERPEFIQIVNGPVVKPIK
jgi:hypothetical protein